MTAVGFTPPKTRQEVEETLKQAANMKPTPDGGNLPSNIQVTRIVSNEPGVIPQVPVTIVSKRKKKGPTNPLNMRVRIETFNRFVWLSEQLGKPYDETLERLMEIAGVDSQGHLKQD
jgi:hypothetical protein